MNAQIRIFLLVRLHGRVSPVLYVFLLRSWFTLCRLLAVFCMFSMSAYEVLVVVVQISFSCELGGKIRFFYLISHASSYAWYQFVQYIHLYLMLYYHGFLPLLRRIRQSGITYNSQRIGWVQKDYSTLFTDFFRIINCIWQRWELNTLVRV